MSDDRLWTAEDVATFLQQKYRTFLGHTRYAADFPRAIRLPAKKGRGYPRWVPGEVKEWAMRNREEA